MPELPPIFVISLPGSPRRASMEKQLRRWQGDWRFFDATDGRTLTQTELSELYDERATIRNMGRPLSRGEIGCALSHAGVYRLMIERGLERALVIEDDVRLSDVFFSFPYAEIAWDFDVVSFFTTNTILRRRHAFSVVGVAFRRAVWEVWHTAIYLVSLAGASKLEPATKPLKWHADWPLCPKHMNFYVASPFFGSHSFDNSIISEDRAPIEKHWPPGGRLPRFVATTFDIPVTALFIRYAVNRDRYAGVSGYMHREITPFVMRKLPFLYFSIKDR